MRKFLFTNLAAAATAVLLTTSSCAQQFWQKVSTPTLAEMASKFKDYPKVYSQTITWGWDGNVTRESIAANLDTFVNHGMYNVTIEAGYNMSAEYLSDGWFKLVKVAVDEAKKRGMHVWVIDEGKYPSGFAGGKFSQEKPELRMQGLVVSQKIKVNAGDDFTKDLADGVISAIAINQDDKSSQVLPVNTNNVRWKVPAGNWEIWLIQHKFKTSVTRAANNPSRGKDTTNSLCDYLNPEATKQFLEFTHVQYKKYIGDEFGKTVLGFRGDEPDYGFTPWTPKLPEEFKKKKGYDVVPHLGVIFLANPTIEQQRIKADYWDVWSEMFGKNFFDVQAEWCKNNGLEYVVHLNHEEKMMSLVRSSGDFFRNMRHVGVPGVDAIWLQIWPDKVADFPKLASSAAHMYGRPRSMSESFAAYTIPPSVPQAKWVIDYQLVRGINMFEYMFWPLNATKVPKGYLGQAEFIPVAKYSNRASYLLANGVPAAQVSLYHPTGNLWMGDENANTNTLDVAQFLSEHQVDYDFVDDQGLGAVFTLENGGFKNLSLQTYHTVIIPSIKYISKDVFKRLEAFSENGGQVIFMGSRPSLFVDQSFLKAENIPAFNWGNLIPTAAPKEAILFKIATPDVKLEKSIPGIKYLHRHWKDADMYFFFNESEQDQVTKVSLRGKGKASVWDAYSGNITRIASSSSGKESVMLDLNLKAHETKFVVISASSIGK